MVRRLTITFTAAERSALELLAQQRQRPLGQTDQGLG